MKIKSKILLLVGVSFFACNDNYQSKVEVQTIRFYNESRTDIKKTDILEDSYCQCFNGIGSTENDKPILTLSFSNGTSLSLCGFFDKEMRDEAIIVSEFNVFNCETRNVLVEYGAMQLCRIEEKKKHFANKRTQILTNW